jgi:hypothetical protein
VALLATFVTIRAAHALTRAVARSAAAAIVALAAPWRSALDGRADPGAA